MTDKSEKKESDIEHLQKTVKELRDTVLLLQKNIKFLQMRAQEEHEHFDFTTKWLNEIEETITPPNEHRTTRFAKK